MIDSSWSRETLACCAALVSAWVLSGCGAGPDGEKIGLLARQQIAAIPFTFTFTKEHVGGDGSCGVEVEPYLRNVILNGVQVTDNVDLPDCDTWSACNISNSFTVDVPGDQTTVTVHAELYEDDSWSACTPSNTEFVMDLVVDLASRSVISGTAKAPESEEEIAVPAGSSGVWVEGWGYEWAIPLPPDNNCNGIDDDGDGIPDDDPGACLLSFAVAPVCFTGTDQEFSEQSQQIIDYFAESLGLDQCSDAIGVTRYLPSSFADGPPCPPCADIQGVNDFTRDLAALYPEIDPDHFTAIALVTNGDLCGDVKGSVVTQSEGRKMIWQESSIQLAFAHELGHTAGFDEEYCSKSRGPWVGGSCNEAGVSINALRADAGCDPADETCCSTDYRSLHDGDEPVPPPGGGACSSIHTSDPTPLICCAGNHRADPISGALDPSGRCIMSHATAAGPRGWCPMCLAHWRGNNQGLDTPVSCDGYFAGVEPILDFNVTSTSGGPFLLLGGATGVREGLKRPGLHFPGLAGEYRLELWDAAGTLLYQGYRDLGWSGIEFADPDAQNYSVQARVPAATFGTPMVFRVYEGDVLHTQITFHGAPPEPTFTPDVVECNRPGGADFDLDASGSTDADGDTLSYYWQAETVTLDPTGVTSYAEADLGDHTVRLTVTDGEQFATLEQTVAVVDTTPPQLVLHENPALPVCSLDGESVTFALPTVTDICSTTVTVVGRVIASDNPELALPVSLSQGAAVVPVGTHTLEWTATDPAGNATVAQQTVQVIPAIYAKNRLELRDRAALRLVTGGVSTAASAGGLQTVLGVKAIMGELWSMGPVDLRDRASVTGDVRSASTVTRGNDVTVTGQILSGQLLPLAPVPLPSVSFPAPAAGYVHLEPDRTGSAVPGSYASIQVKSRSTLSLAPGSYHVQSLIMEPQATLVATGPVELFISAQTIDRGSFLGFGTSRIVYVGNQPFYLEAPVVAQIAAPRSELVVRADLRTGQVTAGSLIVDPDRVVRCDSSLR